MKVKVQGLPENLTVIMPEGGELPAFVEQVRTEGDVLVVRFKTEEDLVNRD